MKQKRELTLVLRRKTKLYYSLEKVSKKQLYCVDVDRIYNGDDNDKMTSCSTILKNRL